MNKKDLIYMYIDDGKINIDKVADDFSSYLWKIITNSGIYDINDIKDIISDTYLVLWNNQDIIDINRELAPYLIGIVRIIIKRYFSSRNNKIIENNIEDYENIIQECNDFEINLEMKEINTYILKILDTLKKEDKNIFIDFYYGEEQIKEISKKYKFSESKIKTKLHRLRIKIRKELLKGGYSINE